MNMEKLRKITDLFREKETVLRCSAVIVAAGSSERMGSDKLTAELGGMPVLARTLKVFDGCGAVDEIIVVTREEKLEAVAAPTGSRRSRSFAGSTVSGRSPRCSPAARPAWSPRWSA